MRITMEENLKWDVSRINATVTVSAKFIGRIHCTFQFHCVEKMKACKIDLIDVLERTCTIRENWTNEKEKDDTFLKSDMPF